MQTELEGALYDQLLALAIVILATTLSANFTRLARLPVLSRKVSNMVVTILASEEELRNLEQMWGNVRALKHATAGTIAA